jgi:PmbA protein
MLNRLLQQAEQAEVFEIESEATKIGFEANQMKSFNVEETRGVAARVVVDGRLGFAASSDLDATDKVVANALESARHGDAIPTLRFPEPRPGPQVQVYDPELAALPTDRLIEIGKEIIATVLEADADAHINVALVRRVRKTGVRNNAGTEIAVQKAPFSVGLDVERVRGDDVLIIEEEFSTAVKDEEGYRTCAQKIAEKLRLAQQASTLASARIPVLFSPSGTLALILPILEGLNGKNVYRGISPMAERIGETLFDAKLTLVDDPTLDGRPGSNSHDDEGVPCQRRALIEDGTLRGFIYDLKTAAQAGVEPTGHGARGLFGPPSPSFSNLILEAGETPLAEIIAGIDEGLLVEDVLGLGQGNITSGDFSNSLSLAFKIEGGEIVGRVKDVSIAGNVYQDLCNIEALSQETAWVQSGLRAPYILLPELNVVTKEG